MLTWIGEFRLAIYAVVCAESVFLVPGCNSFIQTGCFRNTFFISVLLFNWFLFLISSLGYISEQIQHMFEILVGLSVFQLIPPCTGVGLLRWKRRESSEHRRWASAMLMGGVQPTCRRFSIKDRIQKLRSSDSSTYCHIHGGFW